MYAAARTDPIRQCHAANGARCSLAFCYDGCDDGDDDHQVQCASIPARKMRMAHPCHPGGTRSMGSKLSKDVVCASEGVPSACRLHCRHLEERTDCRFDLVSVDIGHLRRFVEAVAC